MAWWPECTISLLEYSSCRYISRPDRAANKASRATATKERGARDTHAAFPKKPVNSDDVYDHILAQWRYDDDDASDSIQLRTISKICGCLSYSNDRYYIILQMLQTTFPPNQFVTSNINTTAHFFACMLCGSYQRPTHNLQFTIAHQLELAARQQSQRAGGRSCAILAQNTCVCCR